jgi:chromate transporter
LIIFAPPTGIEKKRLSEAKINTQADHTRSGELARLFLRLGFTAFGGPAAHIAMMEEEVVLRRRWFTHEEFLDMLGVTNLIPGPNSTEMAIHIGYRRGGVKGLLVAGLCFIVPAMAVTIVFAHIYMTYGTLPELGTLMGGIRAAIIAVILGAVYRLGKPLGSRPFMLVTGAVAALLGICRFDPLLLLLASGAAGIAWRNRERVRHVLRSLAAIPLVTLPSLPGPPGGAPEGATLTGLGLFFLKTGAILYGGGYVLVAFLQEGLVDSRGWLTESRLLDAIAVGQFTPGPVLSTATFIGYLLFGIPGALVSTGAIFFPSFLFVLLIGPFVPRLRN